MTDDTMASRPDADFRREMIGFAAERLIELEVQELTGAAHGARDPDRINSRNGVAVTPRAASKHCVTPVDEERLLGPPWDPR